MPNTKSAKKRARQAEKRRIRNRSIRSYTKTMVKKVIKGVDEGIPREELEARIRDAVKAIDKAVSKGVYHRNEGARRKSRLMAYVNKHYKPGEEAA
ncbi:MAG TPA: 30S ribosomal protein S20 [Thermosulfidibacter takaii]|uniref:Small ribosomal subunit protein bS20 n=1 Tax=Thermosulfidibacter takaii TaxID=412593 RepID=A0A7C0U727_9BACT|nr:30S ribosomal protein S20 [Thermosulfidibacter takaii]